MRALLLATLLLGLASCATASGTRESESSPHDEALKVAETYLNALAGKSESGRELLLGGATANATLFALENWQLVGEQLPRHEEADGALAVRLVAEVDEASKTALAGLMGSGTEGEVSVEQLSRAQVAQLMGPTQASADRLVAALPVLAAVLHVGENVYWNPKNPARGLLSIAGSSRYVLDLYLFEVETKEGPRQVARRWPLKVLRFKTESNDTGWRVLPASDWNAE